MAKSQYGGAGAGTMDDMYAGEGAPQPPDRDDGAQQETVDREQESEDANSAVVSNKVLSPDGKPLNPGDEIVIKVVKNFGDECQVTYAPKEGSEHDEMGEHDETSMEGANAEIEGMDQKE